MTEQRLFNFSPRSVTTSSFKSRPASPIPTASSTSYPPPHNSFVATNYIYVGNVQLWRFENSGQEFILQEGRTVSDTEKVIIDNIWIAAKTRNMAHLAAVLQALSIHLAGRPIAQTEKYYLVFNGPNSGVYATWEEVHTATKGLASPHYKRYDTLEEAIARAQTHLGSDFNISPSLYQKAQGKSATIETSARFAIPCAECAEANGLILELQGKLAEKEAALKAAETYAEVTKSTVTPRGSKQTVLGKLPVQGMTEDQSKKIEKVLAQISSTQERHITLSEKILAQVENMVYPDDGSSPTATPPPSPDDNLTSLI